MLENGQIVYLIKKRSIFQFEVDYCNDTHAILKDMSAIRVVSNGKVLEKPLRRKVPLHTVFTSEEDARNSLSEDFKKGDLVVCINGWHETVEAVVIDVTPQYVKVLTSNKIRKFSKTNTLKLTDVNTQS